MYVTMSASLYSASAWTMMSRTPSSTISLQTSLFPAWMIHSSARTPCMMMSLLWG